jgi:hypothetical protein
MAIQWGSWVYSGSNGMRVGLDISWSGVDSGSSSTTATVQIWTQNQYTYSDNQTISYINLGGNTDYKNNAGSAEVLRATRSYTHTYGANPETINFRATLSGLYNGGSPTINVNSTTPTRPATPPPPPGPPPPTIYAPSAPQSFAANTSTFGQIGLSWSAPSSNGGSAVTSYVLRNGATVLQNSGATSYTHTGLSPYTDYSYTVTAANSVGEGAAASLTAKTMGGICKVWNGSAWVVALPKIWNGTSWVDAQARIWDGSQWKYGI